MMTQFATPPLSIRAPPRIITVRRVRGITWDKITHPILLISQNKGGPNSRNFCRVVKIGLEKFKITSEQLDQRKDFRSGATILSIRTMLQNLQFFLIIFRLPSNISSSPYHFRFINAYIFKLQTLFSDFFTCT